MSEILIKPYEISVWEDVLTQDGFTERKIAVIGSNTMTGLNKVYDPVFNKKSNGEKTLTFSLKYKYFDPYIGNEDIINPFAALLVNERKVKLYYDDQWYEFVVKDHTESSDEYTWTYTCVDAFVLELSKQGYNITFDSELDNNQGTARELAEKTIENTNWRIGGTDSFRQLIAEPIYKATINGTVNVLNTDLPVDTTNEDVNQRNPRSITYDNQAIYVFYSYVKNKNGQFVQFIVKRDEANYTIDDNNVITDTNYRIIDNLIYEDGSYAFKLNNETIIELLIINNDVQIETKYQANRLAYNQLTTYDPVMERTVDIFNIEGDDRKVYKYTDYVYTTSDVVMNYVTNGDNFNALEDGSLQGWNPYTDQQNDIPVQKLNLITRPELGSGKSLVDISKISQIEGFLATYFNNPLYINDGKVYNTIYNSGIENNTSFINSIAQGQQFVFRCRAGVPATNDINVLNTFSNLGIIIAYYTQDAASRFGYYYKHIDPNDIILNIQLNPSQILNNKITGGELVPTYVLTNDTDIVSGKTYYSYNDQTNTYEIVNLPSAEELEHYYEYSHNNYVIDGVVQVPSTKYIYITENNNWVWSTTQNDFVALVEWSNYLPYYYGIGFATKSVSNTKLSDPTTKIGIFLYRTDNPEYILTEDTSVVSGKNYYKYETNSYIVDTPANNPHSEGFYEIKPIYIQDIQFTRFISGAEDSSEPIVIGNVPTALSNSTDYYYIEPSEGTAAEDVKTYTNLISLKEGESIGNEIVPAYNEGSEKVLSITASQSNCFNILQTIAETFECWIDLVIDHDVNGYITYNDNVPNKYIYLREYAGKDNWAGFKYGVNLQSIERTINSDEIVTKLIVDQSQSDLVDEGYISIANAPSNQSGESYILNFDYYYNQGLLDRDTTEVDRLNFISAVAQLNIEIKEKEKTRRDLEGSLISVTANRNVYTELIDSAQTMQTDSLEDFKELTGMSYEEYKEKHEITPIDDQLTEEDTIYDTLGKLYVSSATINNYSGLLTNINQEYEKIKNQLYGSQDYNVKVWTGLDDNQIRHLFIELNDYLPGFGWVLTNNGQNIESGESTVSKKYFDYSPLFEETEYILNFTAPSSYTVESSTYEIDVNSTQTFDIYTANTVKGIVNQIKELQDQKDKLTNAFNNQYHYFIQEGTWNSTDYIDSELYYLDAVQVSNTSAQPQVSYTINVTEISELEGFEDYIFDTGDKTYVEDTEFFGWSSVNGVLTPAREEVIVSEVEWHLDSPDQNVITVQNYKTRFEDLFQRISATVQTVQYNEATYAKMSSLLDVNGTINQDVLLESLNRLSGQHYNLTSNGSVMIDDDRILVQNLNNPMNRVIINSEGIRVSSDGGLTWDTAIDGQGINIGTVYTGSLNTNQVIIGSDSNPSFRWDKSGISAFQIVKNENADDTYDLGTYVRFDQNGLYGIKNNSGFKAGSLEDIENKAHFAVTWNGFFIRNSYDDGGRVSITSDNDFQITKQNGNNEEEIIKIGKLEDRIGNNLYGIRIRGENNSNAFIADSDGNVSITGEINATGGTFKNLVRVGENNPYIKIDGANATIETSNFSTGAGNGWQINANGDATFNNITARGAIKTAVFEYAEIQAVGGIFIFRPSSTIRSAAPSGTDDLVLTLEKPYLFKVGKWCKISNYTTNGEATNPDKTNILENNGLAHIYPISSIITENNITYITLTGARAILTDLNLEPVNLIGGALVDMGDIGGTTTNYGIGINSSDNTVNLPARSISLFETIITPAETTKVNYDYKAVLGTLPQLSYEGGTAKVNKLYDDYLKGTQGLFTDNIYLGDANQYLTFYTDKETGNKQLVIQAEKVLYKTANGTYKDASQAADYIWFDSVGAHTASGVYEFIQIVDPSGNPYENGWYKKVDDEYILCDENDTTVEVGVDYYKRQRVLFNANDENTFGYNSLMAPDKLALRYNNQDRVFINGDGLNILDKTGNNIIAKYGDEIILGNEQGTHIKIDNSSLTFYEANIPVSYIEQSKLHIPYSVVLNEMIVGNRKNYVLTEDTTVRSDKQYYKKEQNIYILIENPSGNPYQQGWYEMNTTDLWSWKITNEHLRLVWKGTNE